ncbi:MAG: hypothetical protein MKZ92_07790 [Pedosphaera sp.]|nr:hypothetical protein [Pedosphaera sp.]
MGGKKEFEFWKTNSMLLTGIDRYNAEAMKELDSERDDILRQLSIEMHVQSAHQSARADVQFFAREKTGRRHEGYRQRGLENIHRPQNTQNAPNAV